jgi:hypothetical protein
MSLEINARAGSHRLSVIEEGPGSTVAQAGAESGRVLLSKTDDFPASWNLANFALEDDVIYNKYI